VYLTELADLFIRLSVPYAGLHPGQVYSQQERFISMTTGHQFGPRWANMSCDNKLKLGLLCCDRFLHGS